MSPVARVENFEIIMLGHPRVTPGSAFTCKNPNGAPRAINLGGDLLILGFWPKTISYHMVMHKKATITLWFAKKTQVESVFFLIFGQFGSIWVVFEKKHWFYLGFFGWQTSRGHNRWHLVDKRGDISWTLLVTFRGHFCPREVLFLGDISWTFLGDFSWTFFGWILVAIYQAIN